MLQGMLVPSLSCFSRKDGPLTFSFIFAWYPPHIPFLLNLLSSSSEQSVCSRALWSGAGVRAERSWGSSRASETLWLYRCRSLSWVFAIIRPPARLVGLFSFCFVWVSLLCLVLFSKQKEQVVLKDIFPVFFFNELPQKVLSKNQKQVGRRRRSSRYCWLRCCSSVYLWGAPRSSLLVFCVLEMQNVGAEELNY